MTVRFLLVLALGTVAFTARAQSALPEKMEGRWHNPASGHSNKIEVKVVRLDSPTKATVKVIFWPYCREDTETRAQFDDGVWRFSNSKDCKMGAMRLRPVEGKNRLEGTVGSSGGTAYLEWE